MYNFLFVLLIFLHTNFAVSQSCYNQLSNELKSTEIYNHLFYKEYIYNFSGLYATYSINPYNAFTYYFNNYNSYGPDIKDELGNLEPASYVIESLITMFETTKDKAYLIKAINKSIELINVRGVAGGPSIYTWKGGSPYVPNPPGLVMWAMAHLCHVILYDYPELCNTPLPNNLLIQNTSNYPYTNGIST